MCMSCGAPVTPEGWGPGPGPGKSKTTAVLLAVFLSFWTWLYTFKVDASKFWIGLGVGVGSFILRAAVMSAFSAAVVVLAPLAIWIWAIVDTAARPDSFYRGYSQIPP